MPITPAKVRVSYRWADGSIAQCEVELTTSYPDALDQAEKTAVAGLRDALELLDDEDD